jgi:hypothetical protein
MKKFQQILKNLLFVGALTCVISISQAQDAAPPAALGQDYTRIPAIQNPPQSAASFTLSLSSGLRNKNMADFGIGSTVWVTIVQKNITNHAIGCSGWYSDLGDMSYSFDVRDEDGKPVERVTHPDSELDTPKHFSFSIQRGESNTDEVQLNNGYKFDRPGKYVIQVSRPDLDSEDKNGKPVVVKSNSITITITG